MHAYDEGVELFNQGAYWEAHERWEECWRIASEPEATFYKGVIQTAAALVHWQRGNLRGLGRNWYKARPKLVALPGTFQRLQVGSLIRDMDAFVVSQGQHAPPRLIIAHE